MRMDKTDNNIRAANGEVPRGRLAGKNALITGAAG